MIFGHPPVARLVEAANGKRFDGHKTLLDPYAKAAFFPTGSSRDMASHSWSNDGCAPLGVLPTCDEFDWGESLRPRHTHDMIVYKSHVKEFAQHENSGVSPEKLGVTAVELMPIHQFDTYARSTLCLVKAPSCISKPQAS